MNKKQPKSLTYIISTIMFSVKYTKFFITLDICD